MAFLANWKTEHDYISTLRHLSDQLIIYSILPKSANITFYNPFSSKYINVFVDGCSKTKGITSHPRFRQKVDWHNAADLGQYQIYGFVIELNDFCFVSGHKKQKHWAQI